MTGEGRGEGASVGAIDRQGMAWGGAAWRGVAWRVAVWLARHWPSISAMVARRLMVGKFIQEEERNETKRSHFP